jgi:flagellar FliL protein
MAKGKDKNKDADGEAKPKGGALKMILFALVLLGAGAGGAYGAFAAGLLGDTGEGKQDNAPKFVYKGEDDPYAPPSDGKDKDAGDFVHGEGGSEYRTAYYSFTEPFTSNLNNSAALIQLEIAASTHRDGRILQWLAQHELAVRSAILAELAMTEEEKLNSVDGKEELQERLTAAINRTLEEKEGFGGVNAVHFKAFLIQ